MAPLPLINPPLQNSSFNLDIFSIAGFFGGDDVLKSMYMGHLLAQYVKQLPDFSDLREEPPKTRSTAVTIIDIKDFEQLDHLSSRSSTLHLLLSYFTMISSVACAIFSLILFDDKFCFSAILFGTIIGGVSTWVVGTGNLTLQTVFSPSPGSPPGDGVLIGEDFTVLRGTEGRVNAITKGRFHLKLRGAPNYHIIGICSLLYLLQFIAQLLLIPQGHLAGQLMFLCSFSISWIYNRTIASIDKEAMQTELLRQSVKMDIKKYILPNRTNAVVFTCLSLRRSLDETEKNPVYSDFNPEALLATLLPKDSRVWRKWRQVVKDIHLRKQPPEYFDDALNEDDVADLPEDQRKLLQILLNDANIGAPGKERGLPACDLFLRGTHKCHSVNLRDFLIILRANCQTLRVHVIEMCAALLK
ncbi:hypothetical protein JR316_0012565 [Psilocybe cubensis]|uniref:Uncharacterized protein n=1 Tax=Psilocybe cubensis TaxID=181762 RepID=A0ACB8GIX7_PSICU|nr:hypothetical protein JR316_0012565 [Psilocybe cubensis]KAH9475454.1 hypothetical protein JR316_0012565 [Psilocybe cubensis]